MNIINRIHHNELWNGIAGWRLHMRRLLPVLYSLGLIAGWKYSATAQNCFAVNTAKSDVILSPISSAKLPGNGDTLLVPCNRGIVNFSIAIDFAGNTEPYFEDSAKLVATIYYDNLTFLMVYEATTNTFHLLNNQAFLGPGTYYMLIATTSCSPGGATCSNCAVTYTFEVAYDSSVNLNVAVATDPVPPILTCKAGSAVVLKGTPPVSDSFHPQWSKLINTTYVPIPGATSSTYSATQPGTYQYALSGPAGCQGLNIAVVDPPLMPEIQINPDPQLMTACRQEIKGVKVNNSGGGDPNLDYAWSTGSGGIIESGGQTPNPTISAPGNYVLTVTRKDNGCQAVDTLTIKLGNIPAVNVVITPQPNTTQLTCATTAIQLSASASLSSGNSTFTYEWPGGSGPTWLAVSPGNYKVTATSVANGCQGAASMAITLDDVKPFVQIGSTRDTVCTDESATLTALTQKLTAFAWSNGALINTITVAPQFDGANAYSVTVTSIDNGCTNTAIKWIERVPVPVVTCLDLMYTIANKSQLTIECDALGDQLNWVADPVNMSGIPPTGSGPIQDQLFTLADVQAPGRVKYAFFAKNAGCTGDRTDVIVQVLPEAEAGIFIPELITPNGDGLNDSWNIILPETAGNPADYALMVYNRYGSLVYQGNLARSFDANLYPDGTYYYVLIDPSGRKIRGAVTILRRQ